MAKQNTNKNDINTMTGISLIRKDGKLIYSPFFSNKGYILTQTTGKYYKNYITGYITAMIVFLIIYIVFSSLFWGLVSGLIVLVANILIYYNKFVKNAPTVTFQDTEKTKKEPFIPSQAKQLDYPRIKQLILCCIALMICFAIIYVWDKPEGFYFWALMAAELASLVYLIANIRIWFYKKNVIDKK